jgi:hypothetical protein
MIFYNSKIPRLFGADGMAIFPFIFIAYEKHCFPTWLLKHEQLHIKQQLRWLILPFFVIYGAHYLINRLKGMNHGTAYRHVCFEKQAYAKYGPK